MPRPAEFSLTWIKVRFGVTDGKARCVRCRVSTGPGSCKAVNVRGSGCLVDQCAAPSPATGRCEEPRCRATQHPPRIVQASRTDIGLQQGELDQVELRAATADALELFRNRFERVDRGGEFLPFEMQQSRAPPSERAGRTDSDPGAPARRSGVFAPPALRHRRPRPGRARCACRKTRGRRAETHCSRNHASGAMRRHRAAARRAPSATETRPHRSACRAAGHYGHRARTLL